MINPSLTESSAFFFPIKATHLLCRFFKSSDQKKGSKYTNDEDDNNALSCLTPATFRPKDGGYGGYERPISNRFFDAVYRVF